MFNRLAAIIHKDTLLRFEGRSELLFFLILPLVFTFLIGGGLPAASGGDSRIYLPVADEDGTARSAALVAALAGGDAVRPEVIARTDAEALLDDEAVAAVLVIPAGFGAALTAEGLAAGQPADVTLLALPTSNVGQVVRSEVNRAANALARPLMVARQATESVATARPSPARPPARPSSTLRWRRPRPRPRRRPVSPTRRPPAATITTSGHRRRPDS